MAAPVVVFAFKRPEHTRFALESLRRCEGASDTDLFVFCDGPRSLSDQAGVDAVRAVVSRISGFRSITIEASPVNKGLAASVTAGVTQVMARHGEAIIVEDDLIVSPLFLSFLNKGLDRYRSDSRVFSLSGYCPPEDRMPFPSGHPDSPWFSPRPCSWGWATWADRWSKIDWECRDRGEFLSDASLRKQFNTGGRDLSYFLRAQFSGDIDSWAILFAWSQFRHSGLTLYPRRSFVDNRGLDGSGTHSRPDADHRISLAAAGLPLEWPTVYNPDPVLLKAFRRFYEGSIVDRFSSRLRKMWRLVTRGHR